MTSPPIEQIAEKLGSALAGLMNNIDTTKAPLGDVNEASEALDLYITWRKNQGLMR